MAQSVLKDLSERLCFGGLRDTMRGLDTDGDGYGLAMLLATLKGCRFTRETRVQSALDDVASNIRLALRRHVVPFNCRDEGSKRVG